MRSPLLRIATASVAALLFFQSQSPAGLVAYWPFDGAATLGNDTSGGGTVLTVNGVTAVAAGKFGGGASFNGTSSFLSGTVNGLPIGNSAYSVSAWFKPVALGSRGIVGWGNFGVGRQVNALRIFDASGGFRHYWWSADLDATGLSTNFLDGNWHHVATTYDGTTRRIYLNGTQVAQDTPGVNGAAAANFRIGSTNNGEFFSGTLDDVAIWNNGLNAAQVAALAAGGSPFGTGPVINSFTSDKSSAYEGESVLLSWSVNTSTVTGTYSYEIKNGATTLATGSTTTGSFSTAIPDLAGTPQTVTYTFRAIETGGNNITTTSTASVSGNPGIPVANNQAGLVTPANTPLAITLTGSDPNNGPLTYIITAQPAHGTLSGSGANRTYTPTNGVYGADQFSFKVNDGKYDSPVAIVRLTVSTPALPPTSITIDDTTIPPTAVSGTFLANISSPDPNVGDSHTFTLVAGAGSNENSNFSISGHQLRAATSFAALVGQPQRIRIRSTDGGGLSVEAAFVLSVVAKVRGVVINEIHYNGQDNTVRNSFVELYNNGSTTQDLTGWRLSSGVDYLFPAGTTLAAGAYLVVAEDPPSILSRWGKTALGPWENAVTTSPTTGAIETHGLSSEGDTVRLRNASDTVVSEVDYKPNFPWPCGANGNGGSMELINPNLDESHGSNWRASFAQTTSTSTTYVSPASSQWKYIKGTQSPPANWKDRTGFDDSAWLNGTTAADPVNIGFYKGIGYGDSDDATILSDMQFINGTQPGYQAIYLRHSFNLNPGEIPDTLVLRVYVDDGAIVWINGQEVPQRFHVGAGNPDHGAGALQNTITGVAISDHEAAPNTWDADLTINNASSFLVAGTNVVAVFAGNTTLGSSDFSFNLELKRGTSTLDVASPGAQNLQYSSAATAAPAIREVKTTPVQPAATDPIIVSAKVTDPDGVASVSLQYQVCSPGNFIPSTLPKAISGGQFVGITTPLSPNPAFELASNWTTVAMNDDGLGDDMLGGDHIYTGTIPTQVNRSLVRYRITVTDNNGTRARVPYADDPSLNFACFVYNGVPDYQGTPSATLTSLPTYHFLTRKADYDQCVAYTGNQITANTPSWTWENWEAAMVYDGVVYDHLLYRLHGANGRYSASGVAGAAATSKRAFKFLFNKGYYFEGKDQNGNKYPSQWATMVTENCWENRATYTFSLNEVVNFYIWNQLGIPCPYGNWNHFRTVMQSAEQPDAWHGDFWGLMFVHEDYDKRFMTAHNLPKGNLYKLTKDGITGLSQQRYQAVFGPKDGSDHDELQNNLKGTSTPAYITGRVNLDLWCRYHAYAQAIRHYDYWPSGDNNAAYYFFPNYNAANSNKGTLYYMPNDVDATWGPTWNNGRDLVYNSLFDSTGDTGGDASTNPTLWPNYYNQIRELRDLLWQPNQMNPLIDQFAAVIQPFANADFARWYGAPSDAGNFAGLGGFGMSSSVGQTSLAAYVAGMKDFAFDADNNGSTWPGANVGVGGRAAFLDSLGDSAAELALTPARPTISAIGAANFPVNDLRFSTSAFSDPQGAGDFKAQQWRIAEVNASATYTPGVPRLLEINASYQSDALPSFASNYRFPATACVPGHVYRARVRVQDLTNRWSHWSNPVEFTATTFNASAYASSLVVSEIMYHPPNPTNAEKAVAAALVPPQTWTDDDFEYLELRNVSASAIDLADFHFTQGVEFSFATNTLLQPGASILIVKNAVAFNTRYGSGKPVAGTWNPSNKLSNGGDTITLSYGQLVAPVFTFAYDDDPATNWPTSPDGGGYSLVRILSSTLGS